MADVEGQHYTAFGGEGGNIMVKSATREVRMGFVRKVYGILAAQLALTVAIAAPIQQMPMSWLKHHMWLMQVSLVGSIVAVCAMACCEKITKTYPTNYIVLFTFTAFEAILVGMISATYTKGVVCAAAAITTVIFVCMTVYAWTSKTDFTGFGPYLMGFLIALFALGLALPLLPLLGVSMSLATKGYAALGVILFTFYIVYDTQLIIGEWKGHKVSFGIDDYVFAALNLYLDIINLFLDLLRLLGDNNN
uniref:Uncharacterized protein n=1 Tax=Alexandrium catenella TaxID=2925 RepID=A0A7S1WC78_ALECA|mmetsp:Transcript_49112/g.131453  ORF Transcript_49112/g.131453 Transcript_49112/m.131453 type:complete len:249 (+) Transcript_49112:122-868(+)